MAYIKERGNNNYFVRVSCGILDNGRPFQKSRLFRPSRVNLPESKVRKELDAFVKALEEECRIEFETKRQPQTNFELSEDETKHESVEEQVNGDHQSMITPINSSSTPLFANFCTIYLHLIFNRVIIFVIYSHIDFIIYDNSNQSWVII